MLVAPANAELAQTDHTHMGVLTITTIVLIAAVGFVAIPYVHERWRAEETRRLADSEMKQTAALTGVAQVVSGGFAVDNCSRAGRGLIRMRERAHSIDGTLFLHSEPGQGTRIGVTARLQPGAAVMQSA